VIDPSIHTSRKVNSIEQCSNYRNVRRESRGEIEKKTKTHNSYTLPQDLSLLELLSQIQYSFIPSLHHTHNSSHTHFFKGPPDSCLRLLPFPLTDFNTFPCLITKPLSNCAFIEVIFRLK